MRKISVVTGSRAEYGLLHPVMKAINAHPNLELSIVVIGMHLSEEFGSTVKEIEMDGFTISSMIDTLNTGDTGIGMAKFIGNTILAIVDAFEHIKPNIVVVLGDRAEILATSMVTAYMNIPLAHIHGGDVSQGGLDEPARHAITKFAHIHFPASKKSADTILLMGEEPWRIQVVGAPGLDAIVNEELINPAELALKYRLNLTKPILLIVQHPISTEPDSAVSQIKETLAAIVEMEYQTILIYPNADAGGRRMIEVIKDYEKYPFIKTFKSLSHRDYLSLMSIASVMVGNSSSGIIEAPYFHLPVVNIGTRQQGRERAENVIDVGYDKNEIVKAVSKALYNEDFKDKVNKCSNPYGDGKASERIIKVLDEIKIDNNLLQKKFHIGDGNA